MSRVALVANRHAGGGRALRTAPALHDALVRAGHHVTIVDEQDASAAVRRLHDLVDLDALIACGGDGTVHGVLQVALARDLPMGIVPAGSGDDAARAIGLPFGRRAEDTRRAIEHTVAHVERAQPVDVIWAQAADGNREAFLGVLGAGFDSRVNARANTLRFPPGTAKYVRAMLQELRSFHPIPYRLEFAHESIELPGMLIAIGNGSTYGGGMRVCPGADIHDGLAEVLIVGALGKARFLRLFPRVFSGSHVRHPATRVLAAEAFTLHAPGQVAYADGERIGPTPVAVQVQRDAVRIIGAP